MELWDNKRIPEPFQSPTSLESQLGLAYIFNAAWLSEKNPCLSYIVLYSLQSFEAFLYFNYGWIIVAIAF